MVSRALSDRGVQSALLIDIGCGQGDLFNHLAPLVDRFIGVDVARYEALPDSIEFVQADAEDARNLGPFIGKADVVTAVETIEHLENPRTLVRLMASLVRIGGLVVITTPNQLSLLSILTLVVKGQFSQFQDVNYPAHLSALLPSDMRRMAAEASLSEVTIDFSTSGRVVLTARSYPRLISRAFPRWCSDNMMLVARRLR